MDTARIMIVEDSKTQLERLTHILTMQGYEVISVQNGAIALSRIQEINPDLVISDVIMPEINGYDLCTEIRKNPLFNKLTIILLTTLSRTEDIVKGLECGANYYITKPYEDDYLLLRVRNALKLQKIRELNVNNDNITILLNDQRYIIAADKSRIVDLLVSIYDAAIQKNQQLHAARLELQEFNESLEKTVEERTAALRQEMETRKKFESQLAQAQKMESIGQLTGGIAHDFNNLLMIISGNLELLSNHLSNDEVNKRLVDIAMKSTQSGSDLIKRLLAFSRQQKLQPAILNISDIVINTISLIKPILGSSIEFQHEIAKDLFPVSIDANQLENSLVNLCINSRDAMNGKGKLRFIVSNTTSKEAALNHLISEGNYVKIAVIDNGPGIPANIIDRVLEPFFTTKEVGKGSGLGLSMVYGFIKQSNGYVYIDSKDGQGTTVTLYLPDASNGNQSNR